MPPRVTPSVRLPDTSWETLCSWLWSLQASAMTSCVPKTTRKTRELSTWQVSYSENNSREQENVEVEQKRKEVSDSILVRHLLEKWRFRAPYGSGKASTRRPWGANRMNLLIGSKTLVVRHHWTNQSGKCFISTNSFHSFIAIQV